MKEYVRHLKDVDKSHLPLVGGKGANLGEMYAKFAVPEGFCITIHAFEEFLESKKLRPIIKEKLAQLDVEKTEDLQKVSDELQKLIVKTPIPKHIVEEIKKHHERIVGLVAVRSSATAEDLPTASFAGQQATLLNVKGPDGVVDAVRECWASLYTSRAIYYRVKNKFKHEDVSIAVVVQQMVDSQLAGVAFTVNPINQDRNQMVIEGAFGLGETVVSGSVTPDTHIVQKQPLKILDTHIGRQRFALYQQKTGGNKMIEFNDEDGSRRKLSDEQVLKIAHECMLIEEHYGSPQDIEWGIDGHGKLHILQSRPITTLKNKIEESINIKPGEWEQYWSARLSVLMCTLLGESYTEYIPQKLGEGFTRVIIFVKQGHASCFFKSSDRAAFAKKVIALFLRNDKTLGAFCAELRRRAEKIVAFTGEKKLSAQSYEKLREQFIAYNMYHISPRHLADFSDPEKIRPYLEELAKTRLHVERFHQTIDEYFKNAVPQSVAGDFSSEELLCLTDDELRTYFAKGILPNTQELQSRLEIVAVIFDKKVHTILIGEEAAKLYEEITKVEDTDSLHGMGIYSGHAIGPVRIVHDPKNARSFAEGDILIAGMTRPEYLPLMEKAGAIVTDAGGLLCHAAIVARELKKPCIIGTQHATRVFKDGDLVEVDAEKGIVRKL